MDFTRVRHEVFVGDLSGHRMNWLVALINLQALKERDVIFSVIASKKMQQEFHLNWGFDSRLRFFESLNTWKRFQKKSSHPQIMKRVVVLEGDRLLHLRSKNISYHFLIMRPFLHSFHLRDLSIFVLKKLLIFMRWKVNCFSVRQLSLPHYKGMFLQSSWIQDDLTLMKLHRVNGESPPSEMQTTPKSDYFLLTGFLNDRKGIDKAIDFTANFNCGRNPIKVDLRVRGSSDSDVFSGGGGDFLDIKLGYLDDKDYAGNISGALAVLLFYRNIGASGILLEALHFRTPIITDNLRLYKKLRNLPMNLIYLAQDLLDGHRNIEPSEANFSFKIEIDQFWLSHWILAVVSPRSDSKVLGE